MSIIPPASKSIIPQALRKPRIISIPLARPRPSAKLDLRMLTYYQFQLDERQKPPGSQRGIANWLTGKAAGMWVGFGKAEGWRRRTYEYGERLMHSVDFEELALRSIDPSLGPSIKHPGGGSALWEKDEGKEKEPAETESSSIPFLYPPSLTSSAVALGHLRWHVEHRISRHRKGFYMWGLLTPITFPLKLIPIIPNLPFFFCVWRSWSHYNALKSSEYLETLLDNNQIVPQASQVLDEIYNEFSPLTSPSLLSPSITSPPSSGAESKSSPSLANVDSPSPGHRLALLVTPDAVPALLAKFELTEKAGADLYRAIEQARVRVESGKLDT